MAVLVKTVSSHKNWGVVPFSDPLRSGLLSSLNEDELYEGMHVVNVDGSIRTGGDALIFLLGEVGGRVVRRLVTEQSTAGAWVRSSYGFIARHRGRLARFLPAVKTVDRRPQ